jgi:3-isopropylmalate/(R)-2-methylmalate dehydratase large subunit
MEYAGEAIRALSMEGRMTVCNMSIEGGARAGLIAPDEKAYEYPERSPDVAEGRDVGTGRALLGDAALRRRRAFRHEIRLDAAKLPPIVTWGTSPEDVISISGKVPNPADIADENKRLSKERALDYMGLTAGHQDHRHQARPRLHRLLHQWPHRGSARRGQGRRRQDRQRPCLAMIVPGSGLVKEQAEAEGLDKIFLKAGFEWREPGCSMCLAMNPDRWRRKNAAPPPRTATSRAARATRAAPIWCRRRWRLRLRSRGTSSISASGTNLAAHGGTSSIRSTAC